MEEQYKNFVGNLFKFISALNRYHPHEGAKKFLEVFDKLDMGKVLLRYLNEMRQYEDQLKNRDEVIFF